MSTKEGTFKGLFHFRRVAGFDVAGKLIVHFRLYGRTVRLLRQSISFCLSHLKSSYEKCTIDSPPIGK